MKILLIDDNTMVRYGLGRMVMEIYPDCTLFQESHLSKALEVSKGNTIDLIIMEIRFPKGNSLKYISKFRTLNPDAKILIFSSLDRDEHIMPFLYAGAHGYVDKTGPEQGIRDALQQLMANGQFYSGALKEMVIKNLVCGGPQKKMRHLSEREFNVAKLLVDGRSNAEIAVMLNLHNSTVSTYKKRILTKLEVKNILELYDYLKGYGVV